MKQPPLIPDALVPDKAESPRAYKNRKLHASNTQYVSMASRIIIHWNVTFKGVKGSRRANQNAGNLNLIGRVLRQCELAADAEFRFDEREIKDAITAYRSNPANVALASRGNFGWRRLPEWFNAENIRAELDRSPGSRTAKPAASAEELALKLDAAELVAHDDLVAKCERIAEERTTATERREYFASKSVGDKSKLASSLAATIVSYERIIALESVLTNLAPPALEKWDTFSRFVFRCYYGRPAGATAADIARLKGITLAALDVRRAPSDRVKEDSHVQAAYRRLVDGCLAQRRDS